MFERYYQPGIGRFLSVDPVRGDPLRPQSQNLYAYVQGNPVKYVDPKGLEARLGSDPSVAGEILGQLRDALGDAGHLVTMNLKERSFLWLFRWKTHVLESSDVDALASSGNVGRALAEWIRTDRVLNFRWGPSKVARDGGGAWTYVPASWGATTIYLDPAQVDGAMIGGVMQSVTSALVHELAHSLYTLHPELLQKNSAGVYGVISHPGYWNPGKINKVEPFSMAFENAWRPADQQRPFYYFDRDYKPPAELPDELW